MKRWIFALVLFPLVGFCDVRLPSIFSDNLVLQQMSGNPIWGWADPGKRVEVKTSWGENQVAKAESDGSWMIIVNTPEAGTGHEVTISGENKIVLKNVALGEVWICAGQSNMGWSVANSFEAEGEANVALPNLRIFRSSREHWHEPLQENRDRLAKWKPCNAESAAETSAVAYYFGKTLQQKLGIPVGIIQRAYAGTPIEGWMPWNIQRDDPRAIAHKKELDDSANRLISRGQTKEKAIDAFEQELSLIHI